MQQCAFCGFVIADSSDVCGNCFSPVEGRFSDVAAPAGTVGSVTGKSKSRRVPKRGRRGRRFPVKLAVLLLVAAFLAIPQAAPYREAVGAKDLETYWEEDVGPRWEDFKAYWDDLNTPNYEIPEVFTMTLMRNFTIFMKSGTSANYTLKLSLPDHRPHGPQTGDAQWQELIKLNAVPAYAMDDGRMTWEGSVNQEHRETISITYEARVELLEFDITTAEAGTIDDIPASYEPYLQDEWKIEPSNSDVQALATQLSMGTDGNVVSILRNIFDYIQGNYTYILGSTPKSCDETLNKGYGDCDDLGMLFASIARAAGVPAWMELGLIPTDTRTFAEWGGHAWVNALVPLKAGGTATVTLDLANGYFFWMPPYRFSDWVDDGNADHLQDYYYLFSSRGEGTASYTQDISLVSYTTSGSVKRYA